MSWKGRVRRIINRGLEPAGLTLRRFQPELPARSMDSPEIRQRQVITFRKTMVDILATLPALAENIPTHSEIDAFTTALPTCPVRQDTGGGGFSAAVLLWTMACALRPEIVVESGVFRGFTTWVLHQACPRADFHSCDISFAERKRVEHGVTYHETDWMNVPIEVADREHALIYFDDHVDQWQRIREAAQRGFRYLIFDDSLPSMALHNDGMAAAPTIDMLFERSLMDGEQICWRTECGSFSYRHSATQAAATLQFVETYIRLPDLRFIFGYAPANLILTVLR